MNGIRERLTALEQTGGAGPCAMCRNGARAVVTFPNDAPPPPGPIFCEACGRELLHVVVNYVDNAEIVR